MKKERTPQSIVNVVYRGVIVFGMATLIEANVFIQENSDWLSDKAEIVDVKKLPPAAVGKVYNRICSLQN